MRLSRSTLLGFCLWAGASAAAAPAPASAVFCRSLHGAQGPVDIFGGRIISGNRLQFSLLRYDAKGQRFGLSGTARPVAGHWQYRDGSGNSRCQVTIDWRGRRSVSVTVDPRASCDSHAGYGFNGGRKSFQLGPRDYRRPVRHELDKDGEGFEFDSPC